MANSRFYMRAAVFRGPTRWHLSVSTKSEGQIDVRKALEMQLGGIGIYPDSLGLLDKSIDIPNTARLPLQPNGNTYRQSRRRRTAIQKAGVGSLTDRLGLSTDFFRER